MFNQKSPRARFILPGPQPFIADVSRCSLCNDLSTCCPTEPIELEIGNLEGPYHSQLLSRHFKSLMAFPEQFSGLLNGPDVPSVLLTTVMRLLDILTYLVILKQNPSSNQGGKRGRHCAGGWSLSVNQLCHSAQLTSLVWASSMM